MRGVPGGIRGSAGGEHRGVPSLAHARQGPTQDLLRGGRTQWGSISTLKKFGKTKQTVVQLYVRARVCVCVSV